jgi:hypothetical protein
VNKKEGKPEQRIRSERRRAKMPVSQRAKQFMPFNAVVGLDAALREKEREKEFEMENK